MSKRIFLSHTHADKPFVRKLALDLETHGAEYWLDEAEIKVGESLITKIREGIDEADFVAVILSPNSVASPWVQRELDVAMNQEIAGHRIKVLPIMYLACDLPGFLLGKFYADFTDETNYSYALRQLVESMGLVFNKSILDTTRTRASLGEALDRAFVFNLQMLSKPFYRPFQYMGMSVKEVFDIVGGEINEAGNIIVENDESRMFLEREGNFITFIEVDLKRTIPFNQDQEFDPEPMLGALSINPSELDLVRSKVHCHTYYDHKKKLKINVMCVHDGGPITVAFSSKYYGM
ncbi:toll/interleukin-1 receptor domain-containing protein [Chlorobaculum sp. 24CR]|uniref:toll/interleukin-1 receptor domain-containing protein n=1 Tax=Chlorobaculum sp. 24CR TaxID=2508878 RepID=UPI00100AAE6E|nr:toll/interleukin-1 receptor domain-containing protein [Chlorobaculum sp. 24CR]RXK87595.1 toll/interleukin-1 receptor domain-containing protein [Chlorobaculum sp. 24CR]